MALIPTPITRDYEAPVPFPDTSFLRRSDAEVLLIVADGWCVWDDLEAFWAFEVPHDVLCVNEVAKAYPCDFEHFAAGDSHQVDMQRIADSLPKTVLKHAYNPMSRHFDIRWIRQFGGWSGTTTFFAIKVGLAMDYLRIVLAGSPMDDGGHWYDHKLRKKEPTDRRLKSKHSAHLWKWTEFAARPISTFVRSMSGYTAEFLGKPTVEWLTNHTWLSETYKRELPLAGRAAQMALPLHDPQ